MTTDYKQVLKDYPRYMSLEQMRIVCHISKKTARRLLQSGLVPYKDTGKKTHTYQIRKTAILEYLKQRETTPEMYASGDGNYVTAYSKAMSNSEPDLDIASDDDGDGDVSGPYNLSRYKTYPDVLSSKKAASLAGVTVSAINRWARKKYVKAFLKSGAWYIPKISLVEYIQSPQHKFNCDWKQNQFTKQVEAESKT